MASVIRGSGNSSLGGNLDIEGVLTYEDVSSVDSVGVITARSGIDVGTGTSISSPSSNVLTLGTNNGERLRILSNGNVGIGTDATASKLEVDGTVRSNEGYTVYPPSNSNYSFATRNAADDQWTAFIEASGQATFAGNIVLSTSGSGINFHNYGTGTNIDSNLLDDYEEGTWTPSFTSFTLGNGVITGQYTKIGNIVHVTFRLDCGSTTSWAGNVNSITGLPFSNALGSNTGYLSASNPSNNWFGWTQHYSTGTSTNYIQWITSSSIQAVGSNSIPFTWGSSTIMRFNMTYRVG